MWEGNVDKFVQEKETNSKIEQHDATHYIFIPIRD